MATNTAPAKPDLKLDPKYDDYDYPTTSPNKQSGHPGHTTPEQDAQVHQLRAMLEQEGYTERLDTLTLLRFLRARKFNVELTKQMFIDCEKWRIEFKVDDLIRNFKYVEKPEVFKYYPQYYHKIDKDGRPVYIEQLGKVDLNAMRKITTDQRMLQNLVCEYEKVADPRLPACSRKAGQLLETCCTIMDLKGVGVARAMNVIGYVRQASAISQNYYPERLGKLYVINAPWGFSTVFGVVKGFLDAVTVDKIHFLGSGYQKELLAQVPAENLPTEFGGSCECDGGCQLADKGPWQEAEWTKPAKWELDDKKKEEAVPQKGEHPEGAKAEAAAAPVKEDKSAALPGPEHAGQEPLKAGEPTTVVGEEHKDANGASLASKTAA